MSRSRHESGASRSMRDLAESRIEDTPFVDFESITPHEMRNLVHELEVHRVELEIQNQQLADTQLAAEESKDRYRELYESAPTGYLTIDREGCIEESNLFASELLGVPRVDLIGRKFSSFVAVNHQDEWHFARRALAEGRMRRSREFELCLHDGSRVVVQIASSGRVDSSGSLSLALLDVTELRDTERILRRAASEASLAEQRERRRLASDLHDDAGQLLSLACMKVRGLATGAPGEWQAPFEELWSLLSEVRRRITSLSFQLSPPLLHDVGVVAALRWLAEDLERCYSLLVRIDGEQEIPADETARITLFRAARELLINVRKHAGAPRARVQIWREGEMARVAVEDEGPGFDPEAARGGFGLLALRERLGQLGGNLAIGTDASGTGSRVVVSVPLTTGEKVSS